MGCSEEEYMVKINRKLIIYDYDGMFVVNPRLFSKSINDISYASVKCYEVLLSVLVQYADDHDEDYSVFEMESYYKSMWVEDGLWGHKVLDTTTNKTLYIAYADGNEDKRYKPVGYLYKVE